MRAVIRTLLKTPSEMTVLSFPLWVQADPGELFVSTLHLSSSLKEHMSQTVHHRCC